MLVYVVTTATQETIRGRAKRWVLSPNPAPAGADLIGRIFAARGLDSDEGRKLLDCTLADLHDPATLPGVDRACERIMSALQANEQIVIYGDYDVDGITASAILYHTFIAIAGENANVRTYVPHRLEEGYGLNAEAIESLADEGAKVIVSVDCGITAIHEANVAKQLGVDLIITDHHNPQTNGELPDAFALVHPRLPGSAYPFGELCGAGVAYKLAWRLCVLADGSDKVSAAKRELLLEMLSFAALGTIADMVPLVGENRALTRFGLNRVQRSRFGGLRELVSASGLDGENIGTDDVGFRLGPRLNACGRMGHAAEAVELFTTAKGQHARQIAEGLHRQNLDRQNEERRIVEQAAKMAEDMGMTSPDRRAIVLMHESWHPGVVGIVCSRLVERFARPTILLCHQEGKLKGSGRSIPRFNLHSGLDACAGHLTTYGGHDMAAGLSMAPENYEAFANAFSDHAASLLTVEDLINELRVDTHALTSELTPASIGEIDKLRPFGQGNPRIRLLLRSVRIDRDPGVFGAKGKHLSLHLRHEGRAVRCIMWSGGHMRNELARGQLVDAVVTPHVSSFSGEVEPVIEDWRFAD